MNKDKHVGNCTAIILSAYNQLQQQLAGTDFYAVQYRPFKHSIGGRDDIW